MSKVQIDKYLRWHYRLELIPDEDEGGFIARYPDLPGCISSGETEEDAIIHAREAKAEWIKAAAAQGLNIPMPAEENDYSGQFKLRIPKSLHKALAEHSKSEGISMNQYCLYLLSTNDALHEVVTK